MKTIYLDSDFRCHLTDDGTMTAIETDVFDYYCNTYIEGYRYVPAGSTWVRSDGVTFTGEMVSPATSWRELDDAQRLYEREQYQSLTEENESLTAENTELLEAMAEMVDDVYNQDLEIMEE